MSMDVKCENCKYWRKIENSIYCECKFMCDNYDKFEAKDSKIKPSYYGTGIDVIEFCLRNNLTFMQGNVIKYVTRYKSKNGIEDLEKAKEYIDRLIEFEKRKENGQKQIY